MAARARPSSGHGQAADLSALSGSKASGPAKAPVPPPACPRPAVRGLRSPPQPPAAPPALSAGRGSGRAGLPGAGKTGPRPSAPAPPQRAPAARVAAAPARTPGALGREEAPRNSHMRNGSVDHALPTSRQVGSTPLRAIGKASVADDEGQGSYEQEVEDYSAGEQEHTGADGTGDWDSFEELEEAQGEWGRQDDAQDEDWWDQPDQNQEPLEEEGQGEDMEGGDGEFLGPEELGQEQPEDMDENAEADEAFDASFEAGEDAQEEEEQEPPEDEQGDLYPDFEDKLPCREGDLSVDDIPEEQRDSLAGNLELKRALSHDLINIPAEKRRKLENGDAQSMPSVTPTARKLLRQWRLERDSAASFVLRVADPKDVEALAKTHWEPNPAHKRSKAEQLYDQLTRMYERQGPPGGALDAVAAFGHRWHLTASDDELLAKLDHKCLRRVLNDYDKSRAIPEILEEASDDGAFPDGELAVPDKAGLFVLARSQCLELLDPFGDALVLGDANLTFSLQLAEHRQSLSHSGQTIATTFENLETLRERYKEIEETVKKLEELGAEVLHNVDCTRLAVDPRFQGMQAKFGAVYYNFPHAGVVPGFFDGHPFVRWRHANLMHLFFRALRHFVKPGGSVKVASNSGATGVRFSDIIGGASASEFMHDETFPFLEWQLSRYRRSYGDRRDSTKRPEDGEVYNDQRAHTDMVYCFTYRPSGKVLPAPSISYPPTRDELLASNEGRAGRLPSHKEQRRKRVEALLQLFLTYIQGIHVG